MKILIDLNSKLLSYNVERYSRHNGEDFSCNCWCDGRDRALHHRRPPRIRCLRKSYPSNSFAYYEKNTHCPQEITAIARPSSATNQKYTNLRSRGVKVTAIELTGSEDALVEALTNIDVVISTVSVAYFKDQIPLAKAAKKAGMKRFVPSEFAMVIPPKGVHDLQDMVRQIPLL